MADDSHELWQPWLAMAEECQAAAFSDENAGRLRAGASRFYYAAYQAVTAMLHFVGKQPPTGSEGAEEGREAWSHLTTPGMVVSDLNGRIRDRKKRETIASKLRFLYKMRLIADYQASETLNKESFQRVSSDARYIVKVAREVLMQGKQT